MEKNDWQDQKNNNGSDFMKVVQDAINSGDYQQLNEQVRKTVSASVQEVYNMGGKLQNGIMEGMRQAGNGLQEGLKEGMMDQVDRVLYDLKNNPYSRRIMTNIYVHQDLHEMNLYPCAYSMTFNVTKEKDSDRLTLNGVLNQRSNDVLAANNWNVCQYALLLMMIAQVCDMKAGELLHVIADAHIYDRHIPLVKELISRETHPAPKVWLNPEVKDFYAFTVDDLHVEDYVTGPQIKNIPIAV